MSPTVTPATQKERQCHQGPRLPRKLARRPGRLKHAQAHHQIQPSAASATLATENEGGCPHVPRLPRETKVEHACHAKSAAASPATKRAQARHQPPDPTQCRKCHACHAKRRKMSPSATPARRNKGGCRQVPHPVTQSAAASPATNRAQPRHQIQPKCHTCHAKRR